ncbi:hypothetical protein EOS_35490 [Caballeronia mineralivorans PML1(12)]|uniref:Uncharacterized protein n=2 Tax=Caballeronia mineralivorans TaxID=2010198 RepID=A0A0J1CM27_9BURK|nr:hypothetical protein EOS_35490 [Caballeronia mineralivorans PML1(12)]
MRGTAGQDRALLWLALSRGFYRLLPGEIPAVIDTIAAYASNEVVEHRKDEAVDVQMIETLVAVSAAQIKRLPTGEEKSELFEKLLGVTKDTLNTAPKKLRPEMVSALHNLSMIPPLLPVEEQENASKRFYDTAERSGLAAYKRNW